MKGDRVCKNCFLAFTYHGQNDFGIHYLGKTVCFLNNKVVLDYSKSCKSCITVDDIKAAGREYFEEKRHKPGPAPPKREVTLSAMEKDRMRLENDILRIKRCREKLRLEKEKFFVIPDCGKLEERPDIDKKVFKSLKGKKFFPFLAGRLSGNETFLCENCGEYVLVPAEGVGQKIHWKCQVCHQENRFEVAQE